MTTHLPATLPDRVVLPDRDPATHGAVMNALPRVLRLSAIHAYGAGAHVVVMHAGTPNVYVSIDRESHDVDTPGVCLIPDPTPGQDEATRIEYAPGDYTDATVRRMVGDPAITFVAGLLIGWGLMS